MTNHVLEDLLQPCTASHFQTTVRTELASDVESGFGDIAKSQAGHTHNVLPHISLLKRWRGGTQHLSISSVTKNQQPLNNTEHRRTKE